MTANLLVVDDEPITLDIVKGGLKPHGYHVLCAESGKEALGLLEQEAVDLAILDYSLPDMCGADLYQKIHALRPELPVIFLTAHSNVQTAVKLMKSGIRDYLTKPFSLSELSERIQVSLQRPTLAAAPPPVPVEDSASWTPGAYIFGTSEAMRAVDAQIRNLPRYPDTTVLISGPTGTGKTAVARRIHELTWGRNVAPFVEIDCSTIPHELCESELFGHEKGAFTGAHRTKPGLFEAAGHGTAFLDEIGELDPALQAKFLHVLEARQFKRIGGQAILPMSARVIAATNRNLPELVRAGRFREDLYFRLNVFELWMPALKERRGDIPALAMHFLKYFASHYKKEISGLTPEALDFLQNCEFPGNVRELRNMIERAVMRADQTVISASDIVPLGQVTRGIAAQPRVPAPTAYLPPAKFVSNNSSSADPSLNLAEIEEKKLLEALALAKGNKSRAAQLVGLSRTAFHRRIKKYQSRRPDVPVEGDI